MANESTDGERAETAASPDRNAKAPVGTLRALWPYVMRQRGLFVAWLLALAASSTATLTLPVAFRRMIDDGFSSGANIDRTFVFVFVVVLLLALATAARFFFVSLLGERVVADLRERLYAHLIGLDAAFHGIRDMRQVPDVIFVIDPHREDIAITEANKLGIPVVGLVDTNCNPELISYVIPGNDDAIRSILLFTERVADSILEGRQAFRDKADTADMKAMMAEKMNEGAEA